MQWWWPVTPFSNRIYGVTSSSAHRPCVPLQSGDWGTQFGMLIQHMSELRPEGLGDDGGRDEDVRDLMQLYRASKVRRCLEIVHLLNKPLLQWDRHQRCNTLRSPGGLS